MTINGQCGAVLSASYGKGVHLRPRIFKEKEVVAVDYPFFKNTLQAKLASYEGEQVALFQNKLVSLTKNLIYDDQENCLRVQMGSDTQSKNKADEFFLCRQTFNKNFLLTNKNNIELLIEDKYLLNNYELGKAFMVKVNQIYYLVVSIGIDNEFIQVIKL